MKYLTLTALLPVLWSCSQPGADKHDAPPHKCGVNSGKIASVSAIAPQTPTKGPNGSAMARSNFERYWLSKARAYGRESVENGSFADSKQHVRTKLQCYGGFIGFPYPVETTPMYDIYPELEFYCISDESNENFEWFYYPKPLKELNEAVQKSGKEWELSPDFKTELLHAAHVKYNEISSYYTSCSKKEEAYLIAKEFTARNRENIHVDYITHDFEHPTEVGSRFIIIRAFKMFGKWHNM